MFEKRCDVCGKPLGKQAIHKYGKNFCCFKDLKHYEKMNKVGKDHKKANICKYC